MGLIRPDQSDVFISYARDDNILWDESIHEFRNYMKRRFEAEMRNRFEIDHAVEADIFMDKVGLPANGSLSGALEKAVKTSLFLLIFVGSSYPRSRWCGKELEYFVSQFAGNRLLALERTFVLVLDRPALYKNWGDYLEIPERPIFESLFDDTTGRPIPMLLENNEGKACPSPRFTARMRRILDTMVERAIPLVV